jgi:hypothetical protein
MGGPSGNGGDGEGPRNQYKKKSTLQKIAEKSVALNVVKKVGTALADAARPYNTKRRKEFISKYNTSVPPTERLNMTDKEIGSAKGLASLREVGYTTDADTSLNQDKNGPDREKSIVQPKVASQMDNTGVKSKMIIADKTSPTNVEMTEDERMIGVKRKGRRTTMLTDIREDKKATLSKKVLLG